MNTSLKDAGWWASEVLANLNPRMSSAVDAVRMIQADAIRCAAELAEKTADCIGQDDPRTGELSDADAHRAEGAYRVAERLTLLAIEIDRPNEKVNQPEVCSVMELRSEGSFKESSFDQ
jgi:FtsZ-binding cell division protein ZapB